METKKAQELINLTSEFCDKFRELAGKNCNDCGIVLTLHTENEENESQNIIFSHGTRGDSLIALHHLDDQTDIITEYAKIRAAMVADRLKNKLRDLLDKLSEDDDNESEQTNEEQASEEQTETAETNE